MEVSRNPNFPQQKTIFSLHILWPDFFYGSPIRRYMYAKHIKSIFGQEQSNFSLGPDFLSLLFFHSTEMFRKSAHKARKMANRAIRANRATQVTRVIRAIGATRATRSIRATVAIRDTEALMAARGIRAIPQTPPNIPQTTTPDNPKDTSHTTSRHPLGHPSRLPPDTQTGILTQPPDTS